MSTTGAPMLSPQSPWPGLRPFGEDDRSFFFGRERETAELLTLVQRSVVVVVYGQSGLGKTSLLQAGLFHGLREVSLLPFRLRIDHGDAAPSASTQIKAALTAALDAAGVQGPRPGPDETLWEYFHRHDVDLWGAKNRLIRPVIAFDQFEEVFTLGQRSEKAIARVAGLAADLESLLEHRAPDSVRARLEQRPDDALKFDFRQEGVKFVISLREDFLAQLDTWRTRMPSLLPNRFRLERMTGAQALDVVQRAGGELVDPAVAKEIVDFVSRSQRRAQAGALQARNVEPALLSVVCDELNRRRLTRKQPQITPDLLSGEREGIIAGFYARAFEDVEPRARDWVEDELLTVSGYRDRAAQEDAIRHGIREADLDKLVDRRILHREERDGVVWLELTHDLLTDPAYASRTQREQRRLAEDATRREAETAMRLRRTTRLAAGFGVLSLAMVVALFIAFQMFRRATEAQKSVEQQRNQALTAEEKARVAAADAQQSAKMAHDEAARASSSFNTAMGMAQPLGQTLTDFVHGDMRLLTPTVLDTITRADESYRLLEQQDASAPAERHAGFLMSASQALLEIGHLADAVNRADQAMAILDAHPPGEAAGRAIRAEATYARGAAYAAVGRMAQARKDYAAAIAQANTEAQSTAWTPDLARVNVMAELGLGELDRWTFAVDSAEAHYQRVIVFLNGRALKDIDEKADSWRVQALMGLGTTTTDPAEQDRRFERADVALQRLMAADADSLRLLKLSADMGWLRARPEADLGRFWLAAKFAEAGETASDHLTQHDRDNLQWKLTRVRAQRSTAYVDEAREKPAAARSRLEAADRAAVELLRLEPSWRQARYVHGALLSETADTYRDQSQTERALALFQQAREEMSTGARRAPGDLEFVRGASVAIGRLALTHLDHKDFDDVVQFSKQAIAALAPVQRAPTTDPRVLTDQAYYLYLMGSGWLGKSAWKDAIDTFASRVGILTSVSQRSRLVSDENSLSTALVDLGKAWESSGDTAKAAAQYARAADAVTRALAMNPTDPSTVQHAVLVHWHQWALLSKPAEFAKAADHLEAASNLVWAALQHEAWNKPLLTDLTFINMSIDSLRQLVVSGGLPPAESSGLVGRLDPLRANHQPSKLVDWVIRPLMPGPWKNLTDADLTNATKTVLSAYPKFRADQIFAIRSLPLSFRKNGDVLYEAGVQADNGDRGIVALVDKQVPGPFSGRLTVLDGTSAPVHQMNSESAPLLDTADRATAYLRFFMGTMHGDLGPFLVVERPDDIHWRADAPDDVQASVRKNLVPLRFERQSDGSWASPIMFAYGTTLTFTKAMLSSTGSITLDDNAERTLMTGLPVVVECMNDEVKGFCEIKEMYARELAKDLKALETSASDRKILADAIDMNLKLDLEKDAAPLQLRLVNLLRADSTTKTDVLVGAYVSLSWYDLFAKDFQGALDAAEAGRKLDPTDLYLETNRAHALLFLHRISEAEAVYRAHLGQKLSPTSKQTWEQAILQDFDDLEKASVTSPDVARIKKIMGR